jgi:hypothetical protein
VIRPLLALRLACCSALDTDEELLLIAIAIASILHDILAAALRTAMNLGFGNHGGSLLSGELIFLSKLLQNHVFLYHYLKFFSLAGWRLRTPLAQRQYECLYLHSFETVSSIEL